MRVNQIGNCQSVFLQSDSPKVNYDIVFFLVFKKKNVHNFTKILKKYVFYFLRSDHHHVKSGTCSRVPRYVDYKTM